MSAALCDRRTLVDEGYAPLAAGEACKCLWSRKDTSGLRWCRHTPATGFSAPERKPT